MEPIPKSCLMVWVGEGAGMRTCAKEIVVENVMNDMSDAIFFMKGDLGDKNTESQIKRMR